MFHITHVNGAMTPGKLEDLEALLEEVKHADEEHPDVAVQHESGLSLSLLGSGRVIIEDIEEGAVGPVWAMVTDADRLLALMVAIANGSFTLEESDLYWTAGYGA